MIDTFSYFFSDKIFRVASGCRGANDKRNWNQIITTRMHVLIRNYKTAKYSFRHCSQCQLILFWLRAASHNRAKRTCERRTRKSPAAWIRLLSWKAHLKRTSTFPTSFPGLFPFFKFGQAEKVGHVSTRQAIFTLARVLFLQDYPRAER